MGIQSTREISREDAIERIMKISSLAVLKYYRELDQECFEPDYDLEYLVREYQTCPTDVQHWSNSMLEEQMDKPLFRFSVFDNYSVVEE